MTEFDARDRIGTALRALAADLVAEKQRVAALRRENSELKAELTIAPATERPRGGAGRLRGRPDPIRYPVAGGSPASGRSVSDR